MEFISKLEKIVLGWAKDVPHLPVRGQKWLGVNVWWITAVGAVVSFIGAIYSLATVFRLVALLGAPSNSYYVTSDYTGIAIMTALVSLVFLVANGILLTLAVKPLQDMHKKGWVLLFMTLLVEALSIVIHAVLSLSIAGFIVSILLGVIGLAVGAYFIAEIHSQFGHRTKEADKKA